MSSVNSNFGFTPLKEVWLGDCYPESYYSHLPNEIQDSFGIITEWTKEDIKKLQNFLESRNITVVRPKFDLIDNYIDDHGNLVKPPITPRDHYLTLGQTLYSLHNQSKIDPWCHALEHYKNTSNNVQEPVGLPINCLSPPALVRMGRDIYVDTEQHQHTWGFVCEELVNLARDYRVNIVTTGGHADGVFCPVAPGIIVSTHYKTDYSSSFPGWEVFKIPDRTMHNFNYKKDWRLFNQAVDGNKAFSQHIQTKAKDWVGNFKETVYEVNMLVIDQHNVIAMKEYPELFKWLEERGICVHVFDFRTRSFWDGGWHCLSLDIRREDTKDDLFPDRGSNGVYWRIN